MRGDGIIRSWHKAYPSGTALAYMDWGGEMGAKLMTATKLKEVATKLDLYAIMGVAVPGAALLFGASLFVPQLKDLFASKEFGVGNLGLFVVIAYVVGQLTQVSGNVLEWLWWLPWGGKPTDWLRTHKKRWRWVKLLGLKTLVADEQAVAIEEQLAAKLGIARPLDIAVLDRHAWYGLTRQMHSAVAAAGRAGRVEKFNAIYGLSRGMCAALAVLAVAMQVHDLGLWRWSIASAAAGVAFLLRMHRFGKTYARELFVRFLQLPAGAPEDKLTGGTEVKT